MKKNIEICVDRKDAKKRIAKIIPILKKSFPGAKIALEFDSPLELLVATILSAQCTDQRVNLVTRELFRRYVSVKDWADAPLEQIEQDIKSTGFYKNKAKNIKLACQRIVEKFAGNVPDNMEDLLTLAGVGRKTANVLLGNVFGIPGIVCDTHVIRLSRRLRLSGNSDPVKLEFDLMELVPEIEWTLFSNLLMLHGRKICNARKPECGNCPISQYCPSANNPELW